MEVNAGNMCNGYLAADDVDVVVGVAFGGGKRDRQRCKQSDPVTERNTEEG